MSRNADEHRYKGTSKAKQPAVRASSTQYVVIRPTAEQRAVIDADERPLEDVMTSLSEVVSRTGKLMLGHKAENGAFFAHMRDTEVDWRSAVVLSAWHSDPLKALRILDYGLRVIHPGFPDIQLEMFNDDLVW